MTVPILMELSVLMGASVAFSARRSLAIQAVWRSTALRALMLTQLMTVTPAGGYLLWRYPDWSTMYVADVAALRWYIPLFAIVYPLLAVAGFIGASYTLANRRRQVFLAALGCVALAMTTTLWLGADRLWLVGTTALYRRGDPLATLGQTPLSYLMACALPAVLVAWGATLWRVTLLRGGDQLALALDSSSEAHAWALADITDDGGDEAVEKAAPNARLDPRRGGPTDVSPLGEPPPSLPADSEEQPQGARGHDLPSAGQQVPPNLGVALVQAAHSAFFAAGEAVTSTPQYRERKRDGAQDRPMPAQQRAAFGSPWAASRQARLLVPPPPRVEMSPEESSRRAGEAAASGDTPLWNAEPIHMRPPNLSASTPASTPGRSGGGPGAAPLPPPKRDPDALDQALSGNAAEDRLEGSGGDEPGDDHGS